MAAAGYIMEVSNSSNRCMELEFNVNVKCVAFRGITLKLIDLGRAGM